MLKISHHAPVFPTNRRAARTREHQAFMALLLTVTLVGIAEPSHD